MSDFENFVNLELPKRIATNHDPLDVPEGMVPVTTGVGLVTEFKPYGGGEGQGTTGKAAGRKIFFKDQQSITVPDVPDFPNAIVYVEEKIKNPSLYGEHLYGDTLFAQENEIAYISMVGVRYAYNPDTERLTAILPEARTGYLILHY